MKAISNGEITNWNLTSSAPMNPVLLLKPKGPGHRPSNPSRSLKGCRQQLGRLRQLSSRPEQVELVGHRLAVVTHEPQARRSWEVA